jgi:ABC-2 type transport system permease protein
VNVFLRELQAYRKSTLIWAGSLSAIALVFMGLYPAFSADVEGLNKVLENFPTAIRALVNISAETFLSVLGFYGYLLGFAVLAASIQAMNLGVGVISKEGSGKTADFLLSKPITRTRVMSAKLGAALVAILFTNAVFIVVSYVAVTVASSKSFASVTLLLMSSTMLLVQLIFLALGALFSVTIPKIKSVIAVSLPTVFAFYIIGVIGDVLENVEVRWVSPFRYYDPMYIITNKGFETKYVVIEAVFVIVALVATYVIFVRKDIRAAV